MRLIADIWHHPANRKHRWRALARGALWQTWKRIVRRPFSIHYHGYLLPCYPDSRQASAAIYFGGWPDFWEMKFIQDYLRAGDRFVDVGANIGLYSILAASVVGPDGLVIAFEPGRVPAERLHEMCVTNRLGNIELVRCAVGEQTGELGFETGSEDATAHVSAGTAGIQVASVRLDDFLSDAPYAMAKFDVEGYEPFALRGMSRILATGNPPVFLLEAAGHSKRYGVETHDLMREIETWNYQPMFYDPVRRLLVPAPAHWEKGLTNVLCVFEGAKNSVSARLLS